MNNENTLFLVTYEGERHEDHIPSCIWPLSKIKSYVRDETYQKLLSAEDWVMRVEWFSVDDVLPEYRQLLEDIKIGKNTDEDDYESFLGGGITATNLHPIVLNENNCCRFKFT
jgi:hypothetical protein